MQVKTDVFTTGEYLEMLYDFHHMADSFIAQLQNIERKICCETVFKNLMEMFIDQVLDIQGVPLEIETNAKKQTCVDRSLFKKAIKCYCEGLLSKKEVMFLLEYWYDNKIVFQYKDFLNEG